MEPSSYLSQRPGRSHSTVLSDLHALNRQFLARLLDPCETTTGGGLSECLLASLATLGDEQIERLANCPYGLFDIDFANAAAWRSERAEPARHGAGLAGSAAIAPDDAAFALAALLYIRQLCDGHPDLARLLLGMSDEVVQIFGQLSVPQLTRCAFGGRPALRARLAHHPGFWADIIDFVRDGTRERHLAAQTRGVQHSGLKIY